MSSHQIGLLFFTLPSQYPGNCFWQDVGLYLQKRLRVGSSTHCLATRVASLLEANGLDQETVGKAVAPPTRRASRLALRQEFEGMM